MKKLVLLVAVIASVSLASCNSNTENENVGCELETPAVEMTDSTAKTDSTQVKDAPKTQEVKEDTTAAKKDEKKAEEPAQEVKK